VMKKSNDTWVCMICKAEGLSLFKCIRSFSIGDTSNATKHLKEFNANHKKVFEESKEKRENRNVSVS
jgi:hypothetical protein